MEKFFLFCAVLLRYEGNTLAQVVEDLKLQVVCLCICQCVILSQRSNSSYKLILIMVN
jgi:hypothetical protein